MQVLTWCTLEGRKLQYCRHILGSLGDNWWRLELPLVAGNRIRPLWQPPYGVLCLQQCRTEHRGSIGVERAVKTKKRKSYYFLCCRNEKIGSTFPCVITSGFPDNMTLIPPSVGSSFIDLVESRRTSSGNEPKSCPYPPIHAVLASIWEPLLFVSEDNQEWLPH